MRIAIFHELPVKSGSYKSLVNISKHLSKKNSLDLYYISGKKNPKNRIYYKNIYFYKFNNVDWKGNNWKTRLYRDTLELIKLYNLHKKIAKDIRKNKYDVIFIHGSFLTESPFILRFKNSKKIYYAHAPNYTLVFEKVMGLPKVSILKYLYEKLNRAIRKKIDKDNVGCADQIFANSIYTKNEISRFYNKKSVVSYLGVDTKIYKPSNAKKNYDIIFVGSLHLIDGYSLLENAVKYLKNKPKIRVLAIENEWIDSEDEMAKIYNSAKIAVCLAHNEPFGLVAIEAMACGLPIIAVNEAGYKESVINNKTGLLIKRNPKELADAIKKILNNERIYKIYSKNARQNALDNWSWETSVKRMEEKFTS